MEKEPNNFRRPQSGNIATQPSGTAKAPHSGAGQSQGPTQVRRGKKPKKKANVIVPVFIAVVLIAVLIAVVQRLTEKDDTDVMSLFETTPEEYDTSALAALNAGGSDGLIPYPAFTDDTLSLDIQSEYGILIDLRSNTVIAGKNSTEKMYPASLTKVLTLIVAYENADDLDDTFTFDFNIVNDAYVAGASVAGFTTGETVTIRDLLYGCILPSGADATSALAQYISGSEEAFAVLMNKKAKEIGMKDSHFVTASGLHDDEHYSTCRDMALALQYAIATPELREILGTYKYTTTSTPEHPGGIELTSTMYSKMSGDEADGVYIQGGKTGYTPEAHNCLASFAAVCEEEYADDFDPQFILVTGGGIGEYAAIQDAISAYGKYIK